ncbi:XkdX family protein [Paenibacillus lutimineralis]|uniref:XkdX family protein n=1 Tax=Paenibacillus lutimineralis TaxID=2707005 RepID=A0A3S9UV80_9BACL|nr:XkdX family protein [Paenibacillus lutimineralis]AZS14235.1 XkdX family protein [Paenibacillus lutimineralis]
MWYNIIKQYYDNGHPTYNTESVKVFVVARYITVDEYKQITGVTYKAD